LRICERAFGEDKAMAPPIGLEAVIGLRLNSRRP